MKSLICPGRRDRCDTRVPICGGKIRVAKQLLNLRMSAPLSSMCTANECRRLCEVTPRNPALKEASLKICETPLRVSALGVWRL